MTLLSNTDYVYEFSNDLFITHHSEHNKLSDIQKLTNNDPDNPCAIWKYDPSSSSHQAIIFHEAEAYKDQYPEAFI